MAADCLLCRYAVPAVQKAAGRLDNPIGVCQKCNALCCGHHGHRSGAPAFLCILCDLTLQGSSAGWRKWVQDGGLSTLQFGVPVALMDPVGSRMTRALVGLFPPGSHLADMVVGTLEEWQQGRPQYEALAGALFQLAARLAELIDDLVATRAGGAPSVGTVGFPPFGYDDVARFWGSLDAQSKLLLAAALVLVRLLNVSPSQLPAPLAAAASFAGDLRLGDLDALRSDLLEFPDDYERDE